MIDFARRRFLFGIAAAPLVLPAVKHFVMPKLQLAAPAVDLAAGPDSTSIWLVVWGEEEIQHRIVLKPDPDRLEAQRRKLGRERFSQIAASLYGPPKVG